MTIAMLGLWIAIASFVTIMIYAGVMDVMSQTIDNKLILSLATISLLATPFAGLGIGYVAYNFLVALLVFFFCVAFYVMGWIGGGDAKLATVTALWMGAEHTYAYITYAAVFGGVLTICLLLFRRWKLPRMWKANYWVARLHSANTGIPYGAALALAGLFVLKDTVWVAIII